jgi:hypothetical protein
MIRIFREIKTARIKRGMVVMTPLIKDFLLIVWRH